MIQFKIISINISGKVGEKKNPVETACLKENHGIEGDAHAGSPIRQVSLLALEDIQAMKIKGSPLLPGDFAENLTTQGIDLSKLRIGDRLRIGVAEIEISQIGKECHKGCAIREKTGDCIMPKRGIFARVIKQGEIKRESIGTYDF